MKESYVYHVLIAPELIYGLPQDYLSACGIGSMPICFGVMFYYQDALAAMVVMVFLAPILWGIGFFMTKKDPEFFGVILRNVFRIGSKVSFKKKRVYRP